MMHVKPVSNVTSEKAASMCCTYVARREAVKLLQHSSLIRPKYAHQLMAISPHLGPKRVRKVYSLIVSLHGLFPLPGQIIV